MALALLDTNVLVHAVYLGSPLNRAASSLLELGLRERNRFCIAPQNLIEFFAVVTRGRLVDPPLAPLEAARIVKLLYRSRQLKKIYPKRGTVMRTASDGSTLGIKGSAWYDIFLATTMRDAGIRMIITENIRDFHKFPFVSACRIQDAT